jgi:hypothetical protein
MNEEQVNDVANEPSQEEDTRHPNVQKVDNYLCEQDCDALLMDGFEEAIVGVVYQFTNGPWVVYDYDKCIQVLMDRDGMDYHEAREYFSFNCEGAWVGNGTPFVLHGLDRL